MSADFYIVLILFVLGCMLVGCLAILGLFTAAGEGVGRVFNRLKQEGDQ